ncbi:venom protease-like [Culex pipiens pallens]|uniref:venom protease-like n=1 Tax=Culex pipiens pallens TaxID=42434 RepID=UPI0022AB1B6A|nr:venom protease-like [Culex pipiens pallens]
MANLQKTLAILCLLFDLKTVSSQQSDACLTEELTPARCVGIEFCPLLLPLAQASVLSHREKALLTKRVCGKQMVCCEKPSGMTDKQPTTRAPALIRTKTPTSGKKMTLPGTKMCGLDNLGDRIYEGSKPEINQYPWAVALEYRNQEPPVVQCGGSLINTRYVVTAAHCVNRNILKEDLIARLGEYDLEKDPDCERDDRHGKHCNPNVIFAAIAEIKIHPLFRRQRNDIALLKMQNALPENYYDHVQPICLPRSAKLQQNLFDHHNVTVVGWGTTETGSLSRYKMCANLVTISVQKCKTELRRTRSKVNENHICAKSFDSSKQDACRGDSGGPMMVSLDGNWYLIGVVDFGYVCGRTTLPGVYARVTSYMDWIEDNLEE